MDGEPEKKREMFCQRSVCWVRSSRLTCLTARVCLSPMFEWFHGCSRSCDSLPHGCCPLHSCSCTVFCTIQVTATRLCTTTVPPTTTSTCLHCVALIISATPSITRETCTSTTCSTACSETRSCGMIESPPRQFGTPEHQRSARLCFAEFIPGEPFGSHPRSLRQCACCSRS